MQLETFLNNAAYFSLGHLPTEKLHPDTKNLSAQIERHLPDAIRTVQNIDLHAVSKVQESLPLITELSGAIFKTFSSGHRVYLSGCGATGRLALALETLFRKLNKGTPLENSVQALMAGGDFALVKSVENFEDFPEYGERHLLDLGFKGGDLLIAITEGGETPYVIGTAECALLHSSQSPWFVYCNPREMLVRTVERSRKIIENPRVKSLCLEVGPMALSGSTRLQAATAQMLAVGMALTKDFKAAENFLQEYPKLDLGTFLTPVVNWEALQYQKRGVTLYETDSYPIAVLTDTTERSPTFSLTPFEKSSEEEGPYSLCYLSVPNAKNALESWKCILNRKPIGFSWEEFHGRLNLESILDFDFSFKAKKIREKRVAPFSQAILRVERNLSNDGISFHSTEFSSELKSALIKNPLLDQILIKLILNTLSLMVMGKLGRFEGNVMTWVRASNGKLIDRTLRYLEFLIEKRSLPAVDRKRLTELVFEFRDQVRPDEAVILKILDTLASPPLK